MSSWGQFVIQNTRGAARAYTILGCPRCGGGHLAEHTGDGVVPELIRVLPDVAEVLTVSHLPPDVEGYYRDAIIVLDAGVPDAAAVQLRRTLEAAAVHFHVKPYPLVKAIQTLIDQGLITAKFGEVLGHIRQVGNVGAHAGTTRVDDPTARRALKFTTQVLRNLFEVPAELAALGPAEPAEDTEAEGPEET